MPTSRLISPGTAGKAPAQSPTTQPSSGANEKGRILRTLRARQRAGTITLGRSLHAQIWQLLQHIATIELQQGSRMLRGVMHKLMSNESHVLAASLVALPEHSMCGPARLDGTAAAASVDASASSVYAVQPCVTNKQRVSCVALLCFRNPLLARSVCLRPVVTASVSVTPLPTTLNGTCVMQDMLWHPQHHRLADCELVLKVQWRYCAEAVCRSTLLTYQALIYRRQPRVVIPLGYLVADSASTALQSAFPLDLSTAGDGEPTT
jgi:hypothetical protein